MNLPDGFVLDQPEARPRITVTPARPLSGPDAPAMLIDRPEVASSPRVWGDREAEAAGLYEVSPRKMAPSAPVSGLPDGFVLDGQPSLAKTPFDQRYAEPDAPENADALRRGLVERGAELTRGPDTSPVQQMLTDLTNVPGAASQGTTPNIAAQQPNLISTEVFQSDSGEVLFRDPATGQVVPTDSAKHVAIRDPADNRIKVYARTEDTNEGPAVGVARTLATGLVSGAPTARPVVAVAKGIKPGAADIFSTAKPLYREFDAIAGDVTVPAGATIKRITTALDNAKQPRHLAGEVHDTIGMIGNKGGKSPSALQKLEAEMNGMPIPGEVDGAVSLAELRDIKELVGQSARSNDGRVRAAAAVASKEINRIIEEASPQAGAALRKADAIFGSAKSVQDLQRKAAVADLRAGRAGYGGNAVNSMRQVLSPIVQRAVEGKTTGFKPNEIEAMRQIVEGTPTTNALRFAGQASPSKGIIQTAAAGGGAVVLGPGALAIPAIGAASNKLATILTGRQIDLLKELVAKRSPEYAKAVQKATERYARAQAEMAAKPSPAKFAAYLTASRSLAAGLTRDGIQITSGDLLRAIQGPMKSAAEDE